MYHAKTKHIDVQYHFVRDMVEDKKVLLEKVDTLKNVANSLTKFSSTKKFSWCREYIDIDAHRFSTLREILCTDRLC